MGFFSRHKILSSIIVLFLALGLLSPSDNDDNSVVNQPSAQTETISAEKEQSSVQQAEKQKEDPTETKQVVSAPTISVDNIPAYNGAAYVAINNNTPYFTSEDYTTTAYENYSPLDTLGRCGVATACIGLEIMPTQDRSSIGQVKPSGWHTVRYNGIVDGNYLYNRCHLIGYQLTGENANKQNLITGTRYLNMEGMLPFENMVADYVKETGNHVLYRVTPIFTGNNLVANGVLMEARSIEDNGAGITYCVYCYNVQPNIQIDYSTGDSMSNGSVQSETSNVASNTQQQTQQQQNTAVTGNYILNENTKKFHNSDCYSINRMKNPVTYNGSRNDLIAQGYEPCKNCNP